jgi:hypothetical protein
MGWSVSDYTAVAWVCFGALLLDWLGFSIMCVLGAKPKARRNDWAGIRIPSLMQSDEAWTAGHAAALPHVKLGSIALLPVGVIALFFIRPAPGVAAAIEGSLAVIAVAWVLAAAVIAGKAAKRVSQV